MCRRCPECCPLKRSKVNGESSLFSHAADECYSAKRAPSSHVGATQSEALALERGKRERMGEAGGRAKKRVLRWDEGCAAISGHTLHIYIFP